MKIAFVADSEQELNAFPNLIEKISKELKDLEPKEFFVHTVFEIPSKCLELKECDLIFVMHLHEKEVPDFKSKILLEKLVDLELQHKGLKIIKAVEESNLDDALTEEDFENAKEVFAEKWTQIILATLFDEQAFQPRQFAEKDSDDEETDYLGDNSEDFQDSEGN